MVSSKVLGFIVAAFVAGTFVSSPELRAFAAATIGSADIIDGSIQSIDIGTGQVRTADIGGSAVTSAKISDGTIQKQDLASTTLPIYRVTSKMTLTPSGPQILGAKCTGLDVYIIGTERLSTLEPVSADFYRMDHDVIYTSIINNNYFQNPVGSQIEFENLGTTDMARVLLSYLTAPKELAGISKPSA